MEIGIIIRNLRKEHKMTQSQLAILLCTSQDTVSLWELNKSLPDIESLVKLAKIFDVSTDFLLGLEN